MKQHLIFTTCLMIDLHHLLDDAFLESELEKRAAKLWRLEQERQAERQRQNAEKEREFKQREDKREQAAKAELSTEGTWWTILGVSQDATKDEIISAYRDKQKKFHPDYYNSHGPEWLELAEQKTKALNAARDEALRARGHTK